MKDNGWGTNGKTKEGQTGRGPPSTENKKSKQRRKINSSREYCEITGDKCAK